ncbi:GIY-YIG nuclease family protein [Salinisphaera orenii]|uniref:GIY-YIG nuclease family protein n=1 Tax=Salinisphaera orenii TaxID=856731 RepID=UPI000DBEAA6D
MSAGRTIRLFLVDGTPTGLKTAEIMNWTGHVLTGPRSKLSELIQRPECRRPGIYFLVGPNPENTLRPLVYIGETDDVAARLKQHNRPADKGGKDFWEHVCLVTSKDQYLTKAHVKHLESLLIQNAIEVGRCDLDNNTNHEYAGLPESDQADMATFHDEVRTILPVLGFDFLRAAQTAAAGDKPTQPGPTFRLKLGKYGIEASAREIDGEFVVLKGSLARNKWTGPDHGYKALFNQLCADNVLVPDTDGLRRFAEDKVFASPSAGAAVVCGRTANGRNAWLEVGTGLTYGEWQDQQVKGAQPAPDEGTG